METIQTLTREQPQTNVNRAGEVNGEVAMPLCYTKASDLVTRSIATETIIVPVRAHVVDLESIYSMDEVGSLIWKNIDGQTTVKEIIEAVCGAYDVGHAEATKDVREFLDALKAGGLIRPAGVTATDGSKES